MTKQEVERFVEENGLMLEDNCDGEMSVQSKDGDDLIWFAGMHCCGTKELVEVGAVLADKNWKLRTQAALTLMRDNGAGVIATTTHQMKRAGEKLRELGFTPFPVGKNPNSGNNVTIWTRSLHELDSIYEKEKKPRAKRHAKPNELRVQIATRRAATQVSSGGGFAGEME